MVSDFVAIANYLLDDMGVFGGVGTDEEECCFNIELAEDGEDLWGEFWVWTIIEGESDEVLLGGIGVEECGEVWG